MTVSGKNLLLDIYDNDVNPHLVSNEHKTKNVHIQIQTFT